MNNYQRTVLGEDGADIINDHFKMLDSLKVENFSVEKKFQQSLSLLLKQLKVQCRMCWMVN